jgi:hypothetical protein
LPSRWAIVRDDLQVQTEAADRVDQKAIVLVKVEEKAIALSVRQRNRTLCKGSSAD